MAELDVHLSVQKKVGLGIKPTNRALVGKGLWWFRELGEERDNLWRKVIAAKHGEKDRGCISNMSVGHFVCDMWKGISKGYDYEAFSRYTSFEVNIGERVLV